MQKVECELPNGQDSRRKDGASPLRRRDFLRTVGAGAVGMAGAGFTSAHGAQSPAKNEAAAKHRIVRTGQFVFPRLQFSVYDDTVDIWNAGPIGDVNLRRKLQELTNMNVSQEPRVVRLGDFDEMCRNPFVFMTSEGHFKLPDVEERNLREFLERGGFILADDCVYLAKEDRFFRFYRDLINKLYPDNPMRKIPYDHEIFHCYYDLPDGAPHCQGVPHGAWGLFEPGTGRIMTVATPGDIHCGWMSRFFSPEKNEASIKMGVNIIIYFLTH